MISKISNIFKKVAIGSILLCTSHLAFAGFQTQPVKLEIDKETKATPLTITNSSDKEQTYQVTVVKKNKNGDYEDTDDIVAKPVIFKAAPSQQHLVMVALKNQNSHSEKDDYRVLVKELPQGKADKNAVKVVTQMSLPVAIKEKQK